MFDVLNMKGCVGQQECMCGSVEHATLTLSLWFENACTI